MLWVTRKKPHVDRCASAWLIKKFIDKHATFAFISRDDPIPIGSTPFTLPRAEYNPIEGVKTTYDLLLERNDIRDAKAKRVGELIHDYEVEAGEDPARVKLRETLGLCLVLKGLEKISANDQETIQRAFIVLDAFCDGIEEL